MATVQVSRNVYPIMGIVLSYAPDGSAAQKVSRIVIDMNDAGESHDAVVAALASVLVDGIRNGNWPWTL